MGRATGHMVYMNFIWELDFLQMGRGEEVKRRERRWRKGEEAKKGEEVKIGERR